MGSRLVRTRLTTGRMLGGAFATYAATGAAPAERRASALTCGFDAATNGTDVLDLRRLKLLQERLGSSRAPHGRARRGRLRDRQRDDAAGGQRPRAVEQLSPVASRSVDKDDRGTTSPPRREQQIALDALAHAAERHVVGGDRLAPLVHAVVVDEPERRPRVVAEGERRVLGA